MCKVYVVMVQLRDRPVHVDSVWSDALLAVRCADNIENSFYVDFVEIVTHYLDRGC